MANQKQLPSEDELDELEKQNNSQLAEEMANLDFTEYQLKQENIKNLAFENISDASWRKLTLLAKSKESGLLWDLTQVFQEKSDMSFKVALCGAFAILSGATRREQYIEIKQGDKRMNTYIILVGESGWSRKTTARDVIQDIVLRSGVCHEIPSDLTPEALIDNLDKKSNAYMISDEITNFLKKLKRQYMENMPSLLSDIYDCKTKIESGTRGKGNKTVENPYLRWYGSTVPEFTEDLEDIYFKQGWLPRYWFFMDDEEREIEPLGFSSPSALKREISSIIERLQDMVKLRTTALLCREPKPKKFSDYEDYCIAQMKYFKTLGEKLVIPYYARLPQHALKIAGLLQLCWLSERLKTQKAPEKWIMMDEFIEIGVEFARLLEREYMKVVYAYKTESPSVKHVTDEKRIKKIETLILQNEGVMSVTKLHKKSNILKKNFNEVLDTLDDMDVIRRYQISKDGLVDMKIIKEGEKFPIVSRPPMIAYHVESICKLFNGSTEPTLDDVKKHAVIQWIKTIKKK